MTRWAFVAVAGLTVALVAVTASRTPASAETAWVLWVRAASADASGRQVSDWTTWVSQGPIARAKCDDVPLRDPERNKRAIEATGVAQGALVQLAWKCLPDTVDPRELERH
jgi:hypothetical protein